MNRYLILFITALLFNGCSNKNSLTRDDAKQQIVKYYEAQPKELISNDVIEAVAKGKNQGSNSRQLNIYISGGLLQLKKTDTGQNGEPIYIYELTEKGKPYLTREELNKEEYPRYVVKIYEFYVDKVNDIEYSPDKKEAAVFFNKSIKNITPFGKEAGVSPGHKMYLIGIFHLKNNKWEIDRVEIDPSRLD